MNRTPEHEQLIDELCAKTGLRRDVVEKATDKVLKHFIDQLIEKAAEKFLNETVVGQHLASGGVVNGTPPPVLSNEYFVPARAAARFRRVARTIRTRARPPRSDGV